MLIINNILILLLTCAFTILLINNKYLKENMINPKLFVRHLEISPNKDKTRLSAAEQRKLTQFSKCNGKKVGFYNCINNIYLPQMIIRPKLKKKNINYNDTGNIRHLFPVDLKK